MVLTVPAQDGTFVDAEGHAKATDKTELPLDEVMKTRDDYVVSFLREHGCCNDHEEATHALMRQLSVIWHLVTPDLVEEAVFANSEVQAFLQQLAGIGTVDGTDLCGARDKITAQLLALMSDATVARYDQTPFKSGLVEIQSLGG